MSHQRKSKAAARETLFKLGAFLLLLPIALAQLGQSGEGFLQDWAPVVRLVAWIGWVCTVVLFLMVMLRKLGLRESGHTERMDELVSKLQVKTWQSPGWDAPNGSSPAVRQSSRVTPCPPASCEGGASLTDRLIAIDWYQFEKLVGAVLKGRGYLVRREPLGGSGGEADLVAERNQRRWLVRCVHSSSWPVRPDTIRDLVKARAELQASEAMIVAMPEFTPAARELARQSRIELIDTKALQAWILELQSSEIWPVIQRSLDARDKWCPRCHSPLVERVSRQGPRAGKSFWGCSKFPECRFTVEG